MWLNIVFIDIDGFDFGINYHGNHFLTGQSQSQSAKFDWLHSAW